MDEIIDELEDGELSDVEYNPLPRPTSALSKLVESSPMGSRPGANSAATSIAAYDSDSEEQESSDSDDSDGPKKPKAPRMRLNVVKPSKSSVPHKYSIWSHDLQEAALNEELLKCDVDKSTAYDKSRNVESYNYLSLTQFEDDEGHDNGPRISNKRRYKDRGNVKHRLGPRVCSPDEDPKGPSRMIFDLTVTAVDTPEDIAANIANHLYEEKESLILKAIQTLGAQKAIDLFIKTKEIEGDGGMMILNGARRRTPGGVYLYLIRSDGDITVEQKDLIFGEDSKAYTIKKRSSRAQQRREKSKAKIESLKRDGLMCVSALPNLLTRAELVVKQLAENSEQQQMLVEDGSGIEKSLEDSDDMEKGGEDSDGTGKCEEEAVSNPPPSPATDNRENSSDGVPELGDRKVLSYDDDFLDIGNDDMDEF